MEMRLRGIRSCTLRSWRAREGLGWLFIAVAVLQASGAAGQDGATIFQFGQGYDPTMFGPLQVPNLRTNITQLQQTHFTCLGDFSVFDFVYHGFETSGIRLALPGGAQEGVDVSGRCLYGVPIRSASLNSVTSFSTMFQVEVVSDSYTTNSLGYSGRLQGLAFIIGSDNTTQGEAGGYLGWLNPNTNGQTSGHNFAVELDFVQNVQFDDPAGTHVGINVNNLTSVETKLVGETWSDYVNVIVWIDYDGQTLDVTVSNGTFLDKPTPPLVSIKIDLSHVLSKESMFVGFSGSISNVTFPANQSSYDIAGAHGEHGVVGFTVEEWTFNTNGPAPDELRNADGTRHESDTVARQKEKARKILIASIVIPSATVVLSLLYIILVLYRRNSRLNALAKKYHIEELEHLDQSQGPQNFRYKALSTATNGFSSNQLLGSGGFGSVYKGKVWLRGALKQSDIAVKRISATSHQGAREFLAEIKIIGQVQHRNLVRLLGWCHEKGELLLVYDFMPNGSLDKHLFEKKGNFSGESVLTWARRVKIVSGVATALAYLHEEWEQRVIHRDVKSSNVMLDGDFNARLGDFGLARLSEHDQAPPSTAVLAGTYGYLAPELCYTLKATVKTDVYSFGVLVLEAATGRRPLLSLEDRRTTEEVLLVDWVWGLYKNGILPAAADFRLEDAYDPGEMVTLLKIGLLCCHPDPHERPSMREVLNIWKGSSPFPPLPLAKPVPVYSSTFTKSPLDSDGDTHVMMSMEEYDHSFPQSDCGVDYTIHMTSGDLSPSQGRKGSPSTPGSRAREWKSTPLPM